MKSSLFKLQLHREHDEAFSKHLLSTPKIPNLQDQLPNRFLLHYGYIQPFGLIANIRESVHEQLNIL